MAGKKEDIKLTKLAECAGCGAKVGAGQLAQLLSGLEVRRDPNLLVGFDKSDDAAVYKVSDDLAIVSTIDFFPPIADDPYTFGAIAATNALSDIYAMGGEPKLALNVMAVPEDMPKEVVHEILRGGYEKVYEAGALIAGGHSIYDEEPKYGLAVTGFVDPWKMYTNAGARPGTFSSTRSLPASASPRPQRRAALQRMRMWKVPSASCSRSTAMPAM